MAKKSIISSLFYQLKKGWKFIWEDDSPLSWALSIILAFILIKFIVYPGLGFVFSTTHPIVAVVSGSMEHPYDYDEWWNIHQSQYDKAGITKEQFSDFRFSNGFNKGDIIVLRGKKPENIEVGDIIVYYSPRRSDPIIHRVVREWQKDGVYYYTTKGDNNLGSNPDELAIPADMIVGYNKYGKGSTALMRVPYLGWIKIWFVDLLRFVGLMK